jgi:hypothetical protein
MKKVKIISKNKALFGKAVNLPVDGKVKISESGELEVSQEAAELLVNGSSHYYYSVSAAEEIEDEEIEDIEEDNEDEDIEEDIFTVESLMELSLKDMKDMAKSAGYPGAEYVKIRTKKEMAEYLVSKSL